MINWTPQLVIVPTELRQMKLRICQLKVTNYLWEILPFRGDDLDMMAKWRWTRFEGPVYSEVINWIW